MDTGFRMREGARKKGMKKRRTILERERKRNGEGKECFF